MSLIMYIDEETKEKQIKVFRDNTQYDVFIICPPNKTPEKQIKFFVHCLILNSLK